MEDYPAFIESQLIVPHNPLLQIQKWLDEEKDKIPFMTLSTVDADCIPSCRYMAFCGIQYGGFPFYTDSSSQKAKEFTTNPNVALTLFSINSFRQIRIQGKVEELDKEKASDYFNDLSRERQITLVLGDQDKPIASREALAQKRKEIATKYNDPSMPIPLPEKWRGYIVLPNMIEFYQGHNDWLADRIVFKIEDGKWNVQRLMP